MRAMVVHEGRWVGSMRSISLGVAVRLFAATVGALAVYVSAFATSAVALPPGCVQSANTVTCTFSSTGSEQTFAVPAGVSSVSAAARVRLGACFFVKGAPLGGGDLAPADWSEGFILARGSWSTAVCDRGRSGSRGAHRPAASAERGAHVHGYSEPSGARV